MGRIHVAGAGVLPCELQRNSCSMSLYGRCVAKCIRILDQKRTLIIRAHALWRSYRCGEVWSLVSVVGPLLAEDTMHWIPFHNRPVLATKGAGTAAFAMLCSLPHYRLAYVLGILL